MTIHAMVTTRPALSERGLSTGKLARLATLLFAHGCRNGTALLLPYDQGLEHGPRDFFANPLASDPRYVLDLAVEGGFNGVVLQVGLAEKYFPEYAGDIPLVLKLNGKTEIPSDAAALSPLNASVEDAVRLGADAVGYTLYVGSPAQEADFAALRQVRADAERLGMPLIVWSYPRGSAIEAKGGKGSLYAVDYAARTASELGADVVKLNFPHPELVSDVPGPYTTPCDTQEAVSKVVRSANRSLVIIAGGTKAGDDEMLRKAQESMRAGATGLIFGRNVWQRERTASLDFVRRLRDVLEEFPSELRAPVISPVTT
jgi:class I fructose-bisphosphate aldolase